MIYVDPAIPGWLVRLTLDDLRLDGDVLTVRLERGKVALRGREVSRQVENRGIGATLVSGFAHEYITRFEVAFPKSLAGGMSARTNCCMDGASAATLLLCALLALPGCKSTPRCPDGTKLMGAAPPKGGEVWCEKTDASGRRIKEGPFILYWPSGAKMMEGNYSDGKQHGTWIRYYDNGQRMALDEYRNGVQDGKHVGWYLNGHEMEEGQYRNGLKEGRWHKWDITGLRNWEEEYRNDKKMS